MTTVRKICDILTNLGHYTVAFIGGSVILLLTADYAGLLTELALLAIGLLFIYLMSMMVWNWRKDIRKLNNKKYYSEDQYAVKQLLKHQGIRPSYKLINLFINIGKITDKLERLCEKGDTVKAYKTYLELQALTLAYNKEMERHT